MSKVSEFYAKALADEAAKNELIVILGDKKIEEASDEQLAKVGDLAKKLGFDITVEEAKAYLKGGEAELDEGDLEAVAGGKGGGGNVGSIRCNNGIGNADITVEAGGGLF